MEELQQALGEMSRSRGFDWVHPGLSIWASRSETVGVLQKLGLGFMGPSARNLALFQNKFSFLNEAHSFGFANLISVADPIYSQRELPTDHFPIYLRSALRSRSPLQGRLFRNQADV